MEREQIIRMAREADLGFLLNANWLMHEELERFATLVASAERERLAKVFDERNKYVDGWYDPHEPAEIIRGQA